MKPFKPGVGLVAVESATPVVPMKVLIHRLSWADRRGPDTSPRGDVEIVFGEPIIFPAGTDHGAATAGSRRPSRRCREAEQRPPSTLLTYAASTIGLTSPIQRSSVSSSNGAAISARNV